MGNKPKIATIFIIVALFIALAVIGGDESPETVQETSGKITTNQRNNQTPSKIPSQTNQQTETNVTYDLQLILEAGKKGEYGKFLTYNSGTEFEETLLAYYVPNGKYNISNTGTYPVQVNVYSDEIHIVNGWEEPKEAKAYVLESMETKMIQIPVGFHIEIMEPSCIMLQRLKGSSVHTGTQTETAQKDPIVSPPVENASYTVVDEYYYLSRSSGLLYVDYFYIIKNTGNTNLYLDYSEFEICNKSGTILDETSTFGAPDVICPGEIGVYQCMFSFYHDYSDQTYDFVVTPKLDIQKTSKSVIKLKTSNVSMGQTDYGNVFIRGNVANNTNKNFKNCRLVALLYNESDEIIGIAQNVYLELDAGRNMNFEISDFITKRNDDSWRVKRYELVAIAVE